jgi:hypothetical protein
VIHLHVKRIGVRCRGDRPIGSYSEALPAGHPRHRGKSRSTWRVPTISGKLLNKGRFTRERLGPLGEELVGMGVKAVILTAGGEPLAHSGSATLIYTLGRTGIGSAW